VVDATVDATHAPTPAKTNAAATPTRLILRIRVLPFNQAQAPDGAAAFVNPLQRRPLIHGAVSL
jgi:hypothetical protein